MHLGFLLTQMRETYSLGGAPSHRGLSYDTASNYLTSSCKQNENNHYILTL